MTTIEYDIRRAIRAGLLDGARARKRSWDDASELADVLYAGRSIGARECRKAYVFAYVHGGKGTPEQRVSG